jgi:hypothetical protein
MDPMGGPVVGFDQAVNAHILRFLVLSGSTPSGEMRRITDFVLEDQPPGVAGALAHSKLYPSPLAGYFSLARAWPHIQWQARSGVAERVIDSVLDLEDGPGDFGGPLRTALAAATLLDLGYGGPALERAGRVILDGRQTWGGWGYEDFIVGGFGSPAWTTALSLAVLARTHSRTGVLVA